MAKLTKTLKRARKIESLVGEVVRQTRIGFKWSQRELAEKSGVAQGFVCAIEAGRGNPSWTSWQGICEALNLTYPELILKAAFSAKQLDENERRDVNRIARLVSALLQREEVQQ